MPWLRAITASSAHSLVRVFKVLLGCALLFCCLVVLCRNLNVALHSASEIMQMVEQSSTDRHNNDFLNGNVSIWPRLLDASPYMVILINSALKNRLHRQVIRDTWGQLWLQSKLNFKVLFLTAQGSSRQRDEQQLLEREAQQFGDIIQCEFEEDYRLMARKILVGVRLVLEQMPESAFLLKTDDDMFLDSAAILGIVEQKFNVSKKTIVCALARNWQPIRTADDKWFVSKRDFSGKEFPPFCRGSFYMLTRDLLAALVDGASRAKFVWLEDVFLTGIVVQPLNVTFVDWSSRGYYSDWKEVPKPADLLRYGILYAHIGSHDIRRQLWNLTASNQQLSV